MAGTYFLDNFWAEVFMSVFGVTPICCTFTNPWHWRNGALGGSTQKFTSQARLEKHRGGNWFPTHGYNPSVVKKQPKSSNEFKSKLLFFPWLSPWNSFFFRAMSAMFCGASFPPISGRCLGWISSRIWLPTTPPSRPAANRWMPGMLGFSDPLSLVWFS